MSLRDVLRVSASNNLPALEAIASLTATKELERLVGSQDESGTTPLMIASRKGYSQFVRRLLEMGAWRSVNVRERQQGATALLVAASYGSSSCVKELLLVKDIDTHLADKDQWTPLIWAAFNGRPRTLYFLLRHDRETIPLLALVHAFRAGRVLCVVLLSFFTWWRLFLFALGLFWRAIWALPLAIFSWTSSALLDFLCQKRHPLRAAATPRAEAAARAVSPPSSEEYEQPPPLSLSLARPPWKL
jgi:hypothetical protein